MSNDTIEEFFENGGCVLERQVMREDYALASWKEYYDMTEQQYELLKRLYERKLRNPNQIIVLSVDEINMIDADDEEGIDESKTSFSEIGIEWGE